MELLIIKFPTNLNNPLNVHVFNVNDVGLTGTHLRVGRFSCQTQCSTRFSFNPTDFSLYKPDHISTYTLYIPQQRKTPQISDSMADSTPQTKTDQQVEDEFTSYYLQRVTKEFAEDLDKVRGAEDFKNDALPLLISALQQGTALFSPEEQRVIVTAEAAEKK